MHKPSTFIFLLTTLFLSFTFLTLLSSEVFATDYPFNQSIFTCNPTLVFDFNNDGIRNATDSDILTHKLTNTSVMIQGNISGTLGTVSCEPTTLDVDANGVFNQADITLYSTFLNTSFPQCSNGIDDDTDSAIDYLNDADCTNFLDTTETTLITGTLTLDALVLIGGPQQNPTSNVSKTFTLTNTGNQTLSNVMLSSTASTIYHVTFFNVPSTLNPGQSAVITVSGTIPTSFNAVTTQCVPSAFSLGNIQTSATNTTAVFTVTTPLQMQRRNNLEFKHLDVIIGADEKSFNNGKNIKMSPGDDVTVQATAENTNPDDDGSRIEDIELRVVVDNDFDIDEDVQFDKDLDPDEEATDSVNFDVERDVDKGKYNAHVSLCGTDEFGALHGEQINGTFEVETKDDDVVITSVNHPNTLSCGETLNMRIGLENVGDRNQHDVIAHVQNNDLHIDEQIAGIEIDENDREDVRFTFTMPRNVADDVYTFEIEAIADDGTVTDTQTSTVELKECTGRSGTRTPQTSQQTSTQRTTPITTINDILPTLNNDRIYAQTTSSSATSFRTNKLYIPALVLVILLMLLSILFLLRSITKPKKKLRSSPETQNKR